jgi:hypothetical protein
MKMSITRKEFKVILDRIEARYSGISSDEDWWSILDGAGFIRTCQWCGDMFTPISSAQIYCDEGCSRSRASENEHNKYIKAKKVKAKSTPILSICQSCLEPYRGHPS